MFLMLNYKETRMNSQTQKANEIYYLSWARFNNLCRLSCLDSGWYFFANRNKLLAKRKSSTMQCFIPQ